MGFSDCADIFHHASASDFQAHNLKVAGSNPAPATNKINDLAAVLGHFFMEKSVYCQIIAKDVPNSFYRQNNLTAGGSNILMTSPINKIAEISNGLVANASKRKLEIENRI